MLQADDLPKIREMQYWGRVVLAALGHDVRFTTAMEVPYEEVHHQTDEENH